MEAQSFKPSPEMTFSTVQSDCRRLLNYCRNNVSDTMNVDLDDVTHCDSAGLALLIEAKRLSKEYGKTCKIEVIPPVIQALAQFCGVDLILKSTSS